MGRKRCIQLADSEQLTLRERLKYHAKHQPRLLPACTTTKRLNLLGLLRLDNHLMVYHSEKPLTGAFVVQSLSHFINQAHAKPVVIVLDNGPIHWGQAIYDRQAEWEGKDTYLFFLPAYSPHLTRLKSCGDSSSIAG